MITEGEIKKKPTDIEATRREGGHRGVALKLGASESVS